MVFDLGLEFIWGFLIVNTDIHESGHLLVIDLWVYWKFEDEIVIGLINRFFILFVFIL